MELLAGPFNTIVTNQTRFLRLTVMMPQYVVGRQGLYLYTVQQVATRVKLGVSGVIGATASRRIATCSMFWFTRIP